MRDGRRARLLGDLERHVHHDLIVTQNDGQAGRHQVRQLGHRRRSDQHHPRRAKPLDLGHQASGRAARRKPNALRQGLVDEEHPSSLTDSPKNALGNRHSGQKR